MSKVIVNAPTQNKEFSPDDKLGKVIPLFVADWLRHSDADYIQAGAIDLWNNVLAAEQTGHTAESYDRMSRSRLARKYGSSLLSAVRTELPAYVITDTDADFATWSQGIIEKSVERGTLRTESHDVYICDSCDATIAEAAGPCTNGCMSCASFNVHIEPRPVLVSTVDEVAERKVDAATGTTHTKAAPRQSIVNRRRLNGIGLEAVGFEDDVVDPRVGLGMLAVYAASLANADQVDIIASRATVRQNMPYFYAAIGDLSEELPRLSVRGIAKAPVDHIAYLQDEGLMSPARYQTLVSSILPPALLEMKRDMTPQTLERLVFSRKQVKVLQKDI